MLLQVESNLRDGKVPTDEKFSEYVLRLCANLRLFVDPAPRGTRRLLEQVIAEHFHFWDFERDVQAGAVSPELLQTALDNVLLGIKAMYRVTPAEVGKERQEEPAAAVQCTSSRSG